MAPHVDLKIRTAIIPIYDGNPQEFGSFVDSVKLFEDTVTLDFGEATPAQKISANQTLVKFVRTRLSGKARSAIYDNPQSIEDLLNKLEEKCKSNILPETVVAKLNSTKQTGELSKFTEQIERLTLEMKRAYINDKVPLETASRMAVKARVKALASGRVATYSDLSGFLLRFIRNPDDMINA